MSFSLATSEFLATARAELAIYKRQRMDVQDKLGGLNLNTTVTLSPIIVEMLQKEGIIDT